MANIVLKLSCGNASDNANIDPSLSIGGAMSSASSAIITTSNTTLNNLFDNITKTENSSLATDYRCIYIQNISSSPADIFSAWEIYVTNNPIATFRFALAATKNSSAVVIANENTAPSGVTFGGSLPTSASPLVASGITLNQNDYIYLWIKRTATHATGEGQIIDSLGLAIRGDE